MTKRVSVNEFDFEAKIETVTTTWPNGSTIVTRNKMNDLTNVKSKIHIIDCSSGTPELVECLKCKSSDYVKMIEILGTIQKWYDKFNEDVEE